MGTPLDGLMQTTLGDMRVEVEGSCAMVVCLHDGTCASSGSRCVTEWRAAVRAGVPIQCVVDMRLCSSKGSAVRQFDRLCDGVDDGEELRLAMQRLQWIKYTDSHNDASVRVLEFFLRDAGAAAS
jgi:hypothetical protein